MIKKASGRSALVLATGLWVCFAAPPQAAAGTEDTTASSKPESAVGEPIALNKYAKQGSRQGKKSAHRKPSKEESVKSSATKKAAATDVAAADGDSPSTIPPSVANANAQLAPADTPSGSAKAMSVRANNILQNAPDNPADGQPAEAQVVSADQLNDLDRALQESNARSSKAPAPTLAMVSAEAPAARVMASSNESSTWDQTSLIGKIFIAFGGLLTLASAARMLIA
jgi:hypothetical protein